MKNSDVGRELESLLTEEQIEVLLRLRALLLKPVQPVGTVCSNPEQIVMD